MGFREGHVLGIVLLAACNQAQPPAAPAQDAPPSTAPFSETPLSSPPVVPSAAAPAARRLVVAFEDTQEAAHHQVFVVASDVGLRRLVAQYDEPGACVLDPHPTRRPFGTGHRHERDDPAPAGAWLRCGLEASASAGVAEVDGGLQVNDEILPFAREVEFVLPSEAPAPTGTTACPPDAPAVELRAEIDVRTQAGAPIPTREILLRLPQIGRDVVLEQVEDRTDCQQVFSSRYGWLQQWCRTGVRWRSHAEHWTMLRTEKDRLILERRMLKMEESSRALGAMRVPCGAKIAMKARDIPSRPARLLAGCDATCRGPQIRCEERCLREHQVASGTSEAGVECVRACETKGYECENACVAARFGGGAKERR